MLGRCDVCRYENEATEMRCVVCDHPLDEAPVRPGPEFQVGARPQDTTAEGEGDA